MKTNAWVDPRRHGTRLMEPRLSAARDADCARQLQYAAATVRDMAVIATSKGAITSWNAGAKHIFGYDAHEIVGRPMTALAAPGEEPPRTGGPVRETGGDPSAGCFGRWYRHKHDGLVFGVGTEVFTQLPGGGEGCVLFVRDDTHAWRQRQSVERLLREQEEALEDARRAHAARDRLLAVLAHELKQPLTELLLKTDLLAQLPLNAEAQALPDLGQTMQRAIRRQVRLIDDLLELSRVRTGKLRLERAVVDICETVHAACATAALAAPGVRLDVDVQCRPGTSCLVDPVRVDQVLSNLLNNAIKFCNGSGRVEVRLDDDDGFARVSVADSGCGIAADFLPHVFDMFGQECRRDASSGTGLGIGLALVHELVSAHGGRVEADSEGPGRGARFTVWLPLATGAPGRAPMAPGDAASLPSAATHSVPRPRIGVRQATR
ncbi:PAS domain-containing sensor histidine kinase [Frateuria hangzhouensis]|uniref:PAS domain-containing sensor histidine kinase n=1 Tax=Frateuria hangzhouensis TaxID=2995589 RepID=UPI002260AE11|nr:PAS domain-containing sensor histidine kinase [Frateuria sp. STR12]MCX7512260.1 PAS domain-containing sensor histidine kinase [Frateuria sp. STR12]